MCSASFIPVRTVTHDRPASDIASRRFALEPAVRGGPRTRVRIQRPPGLSSKEKHDSSNDGLHGRPTGPGRSAGHATKAPLEARRHADGRDVLRPADAQRSGRHDGHPALPVHEPGPRPHAVPGLLGPPRHTPDGGRFHRTPFEGRRRLRPPQGDDHLHRGHLRGLRHVSTRDRFHRPGDRPRTDRHHGRPGAGGRHHERPPQQFRPQKGHRHHRRRTGHRRHPGLWRGRAHGGRRRNLAPRLLDRRCPDHTEHGRHAAVGLGLRRHAAQPRPEQAHRRRRRHPAGLLPDRHLHRPEPEPRLGFHLACHPDLGDRRRRGPWPGAHRGIPQQAAAG